MHGRNGGLSYPATHLKKIILEYWNLLILFAEDKAKNFGVLWEREKFISGVADPERQHGAVMALISRPHFWG